MGWTYYHANYYKNGKVDRKQELDEMNTWKKPGRKSVVLKSVMKGATYYAAVRFVDEMRNRDEVYALVCLTHECNREYCNFGYKDMSEDMYPGECECPKSILDLLTPTDNQWANEWRKQCRENSNRKKPSDLPVGTTIRFKAFNGEVIEVVKRSPNYQFKRTWWHRVENNTYVPSRRIPRNFEIVA